MRLTVVWVADYGKVADVAVLVAGAALRVGHDFLALDFGGGGLMDVRAATEEVSVTGLSCA